MLLGAAAEWDIGATLAWAAFGAGIAQMLLLWIAAGRLGMVLLPRRPRLMPDVRRLVALGVPAALAGGVMQINLVVGTQVASYFDGAVGWLWYADRIYQLPLGVVGVAIGVVLLPELSRRFRAGDLAGTRHSMNRAAEFTLILTVPATIGLLAMPGLITAVLYERGAFTPDDTRATALALAVYAVGLPAFVLQKVLQPAFFAREDTRTPLRYALISMVVNIVVAVGLAPVIGFLAAALGTTLAGWANLYLLWHGVRRLDRELHVDARLAHRLPRVVVAAAIMGLVVLLMAVAAEAIGPGFRALALAVIMSAALATYAMVANGLGAVNLADVRAAVRRTRE